MRHDILRTVAGILLAAVAASGCRSRPRDAQWRADSADYVANLSAWLRDSAVVDSITRSIDLAEFLASYEAMVKAPQPLLAHQRVLCERLRVSWDYGSVPAELAAGRARDRVKRVLGSEAFDEAFERTPRTGFVEAPSGAECKGKRDRPLEVIGATSLQIRNPRPIPPRGWPK
jgi:hypothetical protein